MSNVLAFSPRQNPNLSRNLDEPCRIMIFSGIRIERIGDDEEETIAVGQNGHKRGQRR